MKRVRFFWHRIVFVATLFMLTTFQGYAQGYTPRRPLTPSNVIGTWFGFEDGMGGFVRIEFDKDGTGYLARVSAVDSPPSLYFIERWTIKKFDIDIVIRPIGKDSPPLSIYKVASKGSQIHIEFGDDKINWRTMATLVLERKFVSQNNKVRNKIAGYRKEKEHEEKKSEEVAP